MIITLINQTHILNSKPTPCINLFANKSLPATIALVSTVLPFVVPPMLREQYSKAMGSPDTLHQRLLELTDETGREEMFVGFCQEGGHTGDTTTRLVHAKRRAAYGQDHAASNASGNTTI